jgi:predicted Zn-dependent protease
MLNFDNLFKKVYGDIIIARKLIMERAMELKKKLGISLSESLKRAWAEARKIAEEFISNLKNYKLHIDKRTFNIQSDDAEDIVEKCFEKIAEVKGKQFMYNVSKNIYNKWNTAIHILETRGALTFGQDVFVRKVNFINA